MTKMMFALCVVFAVACGGEEAPAPAPEPAAKPAPAPAPPAGEKPAPAKKARVFFKAPADGATLKSPVKFEFGVQGMTVKPAGEIVEGTGHHHIILAPAGIEAGTVVPADAKHIHFGKGQIETEQALPPGKHKVTLQFANGSHISYGPEMSATIEINVEE